MPSPRDIRRRIKSISSTAQITKAMQMVAASKMRKAQQAATRRRRRSRGCSTASSAARRRGRVDFTHPLLEVREVRKRAVDPRRRRQGPVRRAQHATCSGSPSQFDPATTVFITAGRKAAQFVARTGRQLVAEFPYGDSPTFAEARAIAAFARDLFLKGEVDEVQIVATRFVNTLTQEPVTLEFLPVGEIKGLKVPGAESEDELAADTTRDRCSSRAPKTCSATCSAHYLNIFIYHVLLNAKASEQSARMVAMKNATDNAESADQGPDARIQQAAPGQHHEGTAGDRRRPGRAMTLSNEHATHEHRQDRSGRRSGGGRRVSRRRCPAIYNALTVDYTVDGPAGHADARSAAAPRRQLGAHHLDVRHRRAQARLRGHRHRRPDLHAGRRRRDGPRVRRDRQSGRRARPGQGREVLSDSSAAAAAGRPVDVAAGARPPASRSSI